MKCINESILRVELGLGWQRGVVLERGSGELSLSSCVYLRSLALQTPTLRNTPHFNSYAKNTPSPHAIIIII